MPRFLKLAAMAVLGGCAFFATPQAMAQGFFDDLFGSFDSGPQSRAQVRFSSSYAPGTIIVSFGDRRLYYIEGRGKAISYPIAIPKDEARWSGTSVVSQKKVNPDWTPTADMRRENPKLPAYVPGGHPLNPLGVRALYLGSSLYRIHGTDAPWLIGKQVSHGCIRMYNNDVIDLYQRAKVGTPVIVTWKRFGTDS
jgi:lipoprotein-anchoring transpeptidase ErfK/SrfK